LNHVEGLAAACDSISNLSLADHEKSSAGNTDPIFEQPIQAQNSSLCPSTELVPFWKHVKEMMSSHFLSHTYQADRPTTRTYPSYLQGTE